MTPQQIRVGTAADIPLLREIEVSAGVPFRDAGMLAVAEDDPPSTAELAEPIARGHVWVSVDQQNYPVAYAHCEVVDGDVHLEQLSVRSDVMRQGIGTALLTHVIAWARRLDYPAITLTTFTEVPWNGPYYQHHGFRYVDADSPGLQAIRASEVAAGLDRWPRSCMRLDLR